VAISHFYAQPVAVYFALRYRVGNAVAVLHPVGWQHLCPAFGRERNGAAPTVRWQPQLLFARCDAIG